MTEITVISKGEYSDYHIVCAVPSQEAGERVIAELGDSAYDYRVETLTYLEDPKVAESLTLSWSCDQDGVERNSREWTVKEIVGLQYGSPECEARYNFFPGNNKPADHKRYQPSRGQLQVRGTDQQRVRKVFSEKKARIIADEIRSLYSSGEYKQKELAEMFGIGTSQTNRIVRGMVR